MKKRYFSILFFFSLAFFSVFADPCTDVNSDFYTDAAGWYLRGLVSKLPQLKPYSAQQILSILETVSENGEEKDRIKTEFYIQKYFNKSWNVNLNGKYAGLLKKYEKKVENRYENLNTGKAKVSIAGVYHKDFISMAYDFGAIMISDEAVEKKSFPLHLYDTDSRYINNYSINAGFIDFLFDTNARFVAGSRHLNFAVGFNKLSFGSCTENALMLSTNSYQLLNASFNYEGKFFQYSKVFALPGTASNSDINDFTIGKYFSFQSLKVPLYKDIISMSFYESVFLGGYFMPAYFMTVPYFIIANVSGFNENVISGLQFEILNKRSFAVVADVFFDDFKLKKMMKLKFNDAAVRTGFKIGFSYSPPESICDFTSISYTLLTPYTYTKYSPSKKYNYYDFSNFGTNLGTSLEPNSDSIVFKMHFSPFHKLKIKTTTVLTRHANAFESLSDSEVLNLAKEGLLEDFMADGSYRMSALPVENAIDYTAFLKQNHISYKMVFGMDFEYEIFSKNSMLALVKAGYTIQYIRKDGVDTPMFAGLTKTAVLSDIQNSRQEWEKQLKNSFYHFFNLGVELRF